MQIPLIVLILFLMPALYADVAINFNQDNWKEIKLKTNPNTFEFGEKLKIKVNKSSSPVVIKFDDVQEFSTLQFEATVDGEMKPQKKDTDFEEDSYLQFGFVVIGDNQLGAMGKMFAPGWVSDIFALAPEGQGLDKIYFYNVSMNPASVNKERQNPKSKYMFEKIIFTKNDLGKLLTFVLPKKLKTTALWVGAKGDATESEFTTSVNKIVLK